MPRFRPRALRACSNVVRDPRARRTNRVTKSTGAAIHVDLVVINAEIAHRRHRDDGKRLVDFIQVDIVGAPAKLVVQDPYCRDRRRGEPCRLLSKTGVTAGLQSVRHLSSRPPMPASGSVLTRHRISTTTLPQSRCRLWQRLDAGSVSCRCLPCLASRPFHRDITACACSS